MTRASLRWTIALGLAACGDQRSTLNAERSTPDAQRSTLNAERSTPDAQRSTLNAQRSTPDASSRDACLARADALAAEDRAIIRALCSELHTHGIPGASLAIARDGAVHLRFATGLRCLGTPAAVTDDTAFRIGSLTKAITAALAHALVDDGVLALDRPLDAELGARIGAPPGFTPTLRRLLDHTAGLPDVLPTEAMRKLDPAAQVRALLGTPDDTTHWRYANGGYALAGAWLATKGGAPWHELATTRVLQPLHMNHTHATLPPANTDVACGHLRESSGLVAYDVATDYDRFAHGVLAAAPSGAIIASADDLVRFAIALGDRPPADAPPWTRTLLTELRTTAVPTGRRSGERYAAGVVVETLPGGDTLLHHSGQTGDFAAELAWVPERGFAVAILSNGGVSLRATLAAALAGAGIDPRR